MPKWLLTSVAGILANNTRPALKNRLIRYFIKKYGVNMQEAIAPNASDYACFNDFFTRLLKPGARNAADTVIISPVDGMISQIGRIKNNTIIQAKKHCYTLEALLASDTQSVQDFKNGLFATLYLSPRDYHRVHMPIDATLCSLTHVPGKLFSVQPFTVDNIPQLFANNERLVARFETKYGPMAMILVGATLVGAIGTCWQGDLKRVWEVTQYPIKENYQTHLKKFQEMGYFKLGSTVILLFSDPNQQLQWQPGLCASSAIRLGEALGCDTMDAT